jgi:hypothetical protein
MRNSILTVVLLSALAANTSLFAQANADDVTQLKRRVAQLEKQVQELSRLVEPLKAQQAAENRRKALRPKFEKRMAQDRDKYTPEQLRDAEQLMGVADQKWASLEANESCQTIIKKYPEANRAGCAMLYVAQQSQGDDRVRRLNDCIGKYGDCIYGDGVQVGAYARLLLAEHYRNAGDKAKADTLTGEIRTNYADSVDHRGRLLVNIIDSGAK